MTNKTKQIYFIGTDFSHDSEVYVMVCEPSELTEKIDEFIRDQYCDRDHVVIYEAGRKGVLPKSVVTFV